MKVTFDTETDSVEDLQQVLNMLNSALQKRSANSLPKSANEIFTVGRFVEAPKMEQQSANKLQEQQTPIKTAGGGRITPFQDLSSMMSNIFSNQPTRRTR